MGTGGKSMTYTIPVQEVELTGVQKPKMPEFSSTCAAAVLPTQFFESLVSEGKDYSDTIKLILAKETFVIESGTTRLNWTRMIKTQRGLKKSINDDSRDEQGMIDAAI